MKRPILYTILFIMTFSSVRAQLYLGSSEQLFITAGDSLSFDGLTLKPSSNFILSNTTISKNNTVNHTSPNSTIARAYAFSNAISGFTGSARIDYLDAELNSIPESNLQMSIYDGSAWQSINTAYANANTNFLTGNAISNMTISEVTLVSALSILPVRWLSFSGKLNGETVLLNWTTASELNAKEFIVEQSNDRNYWKAIGKVKAMGNSATVQDYSFEDASPNPGNNFYRLTEVDLNGRTSKSQIVHVINAVKPLPLQVFPNPVSSGNLNIRMQQPATVKVFGPSGELLISKAMGIGLQQLDVQQLKPGIYRLNVLNEIISFMKL